MALRRRVLGDAHVDRSNAQTTKFDEPLQRYVTENCWEGIWSRPGLPPETRSMLCMAILAALNRPEELRAHVRGAVRNGVTENQIQEVLLQVTFYCGGPAGLDGFRIAKSVLSEPEVM